MAVVSGLKVRQSAGKPDACEERDSSSSTTNALAPALNKMVKLSRVACATALVVHSSALLPSSRRPWLRPAARRRRGIAAATKLQTEIDESLVAQLEPPAIADSARDSIVGAEPSGDPADDSAAAFDWKQTVAPGTRIAAFRRKRLRAEESPVDARTVFKNLRSAPPTTWLLILLFVPLTFADVFFNMSRMFICLLPDLCSPV